MIWYKHSCNQRVITLKKYTDVNKKAVLSCGVSSLPGDFAAEMYSEHCMVASDIIECICDAVSV